MDSTYFETGDVLRIRLSEKPVAHEVPHGDNVYIAYADDGTVVHVVLLNARAQGWIPLRVKLPLPSSVARLREAIAYLLPCP
jgi:hypothetical protein